MARKGEHKPKENLVGRKFGKLTVIKYAGYKTTAAGIVYHQWLCNCDCGNTKIATGRDLNSLHCQSCGCLPHKAKNISWAKHHKSNTRLYNVWKSMKGRCYTKSCSNYDLYGGRGITVCDEWKNSFTSFYEWAIENGYKEVAERNKYTLDRIDVNGNYEPSNCRWVDMNKQANNRRSNTKFMYVGESLTLREISERTGTKYSLLRGRVDRGLSIEEAISAHYEPTKYEHNGERHSIPEWARITGLKEETIRSRLLRGWSIEKTLTEPLDENKYRRNKKK